MSSQHIIDINESDVVRRLAWKHTKWTNLLNIHFLLTYLIVEVICPPENKCMNKVEKELSGRVVVSQCYS